MADNEMRDFKGVWIPSSIWLDERLSAVEKVLYAEIDSLSGGDLGCIKTNKTLAVFCQCSERTVTNAISHLKELDLIEVESFNGRQRVLRGRVAKFARQGSKICEAESQNLRGAYIDSNTTSNPSSNTEDIKDSEPRTNDVKAILDYLNSKTGKHFKNVKKTRELITARYNEGYRLEDFKRVIDVKCAQWLNDQRMRRYLQPSTLFGTKFEGYANEEPVRPSQDYSPYSLENWGDVERREG